jgi:CheY-like chemotaxis protein
VQLRLELEGQLPHIEADASQLQQLIMNLVMNGAEAIEEGKSGTVRVTTAIRNLDEDDLREAFHSDIKPGQYVLLEVHDTGSGMDKETLSRIFDPFFTTKFMGRGLGLAAAQGIVRSHKGIINVISAPGEGSTFQVLFPALEADVAKRGSVAGEAPEVSAKPTILVVDDEEIVRRTAKATLHRYGYAVLLAENGRAAVDLFQTLSDQISLVLLDLTMPVMSGEETLQRLQAIRPNVRVLLTSGYNQLEVVRRFQTQGLAGFIQKPYSAIELAEKVKTAILRDSAGSFQGLPDPSDKIRLA